MSRTIESTQAPVNAPAVNTQGLDQVSNAVVNAANTQQTLRIAGLNGERMLRFGIRRKRTYRCRFN